MSPEYAGDGIFLVKSDVFSFGVLVLEIVSGKRNRGFCDSDHKHNLLGHVSLKNEWSFYTTSWNVVLMESNGINLAVLMANSWN